MYAAGRVAFKARNVSDTGSLNGSWVEYSEGTYEAPEFHAGGR